MATANHELLSLKFSSFGRVVISSTKKHSVGAMCFRFSFLLALMRPSYSFTMFNKFWLESRSAAVL